MLGAALRFNVGAYFAHVRWVGKRFPDRDCAPAAQ